MNKLLKKIRNKSKAQAMVEFMLALPVLLVLIYAIIEFSRMIFILASVANASRQAARYGAGSGELSGYTYYQDCDGIREVANRSAILAEFDEINITYDRGLTEDGEQIQILDIDPDPDTDSCPIEDNVIRNGDRIIVQVRASYEPIIDILPVEPIEVVSASARTFLISVPIFGSAMPTGFAAETSTPSRVPTDTETPRTPTLPPTATFTLPPYPGVTPGIATRTPTAGPAAHADVYPVENAPPHQHCDRHPNRHQLHRADRRLSWTAPIQG
ncbi:MAG: pilus assembly protein [Chloroflexi bacterium]|nr:pilus assembly protein [Chloroflexota bacterium]